MNSVPWIGKNYPVKLDSIRHWLHWVESDDKRVLQNLNQGGRKQSEWDDHKEEYPITLDGPHVYGTTKIPPGKYIMSLYFFNKDGHTSTAPLPWWGTQSMDTILCLRDSNPRWFYGSARNDLLALSRAFVRIEDGKPRAALVLDRTDKEKIRPDVATVLRNAQMHDYADLVDFTDRKYASCSWNARTELGRKRANEYIWDYKIFYEFSRNGKYRQTW